MSIQLPQSFSVKMQSSKGLIGDNQVLMDSSKKPLVYIKGIGVASKIELFEDDKMSVPFAKVANGKIIDNQGKPSASFTYKNVPSSNPLTITTAEGKTLAVKTGNVVLPILRRLGALGLLIPIKYGLYDGERLLALFSMPIVLGAKRVECEIKEMNVLSNELLASIAAMMNCY